MALRLRVFPHSERGSAERLARYVEDIFWSRPGAADDLPSLVYEDEAGQVAGFLGVIPRRMLFRGEVVRVAVATQLMVAPERRGAAGLMLARAFIAGPQDLSLSDTANEGARRLWTQVGGSVSLLHSLSWQRVLRPWRHGAAGLAQSTMARAAVRAVRPLLTMADQITSRRSGFERHRPPAGDVEPATAALIAAHAEAVLGRYPLRPRYDPDTLGWLLARAAEKRQFGPLYGALVRSSEGEVLGWFLHHVTPGGLSQVLQLAARRSGRARVVEHLLFDAWRRGARAVTGRLDQHMLPDLYQRGATIRHEGAWTLYYARRSDIMHAIARGDAFVSRLEGEWWLSF